MTAEEKKAWLVNLVVALLDRIEMEDIDEEEGDTLTYYVESMDVDDAEEAFDEAVGTLSVGELTK